MRVCSPITDQLGLSDGDAHSLAYARGTGDHSTNDRDADGILGAGIGDTHQVWAVVERLTHHLRSMGVEMSEDVSGVEMEVMGGLLQVDSEVRSGVRDIRMRYPEVSILVDARDVSGRQLDGVTEVREADDLESDDLDSF
eukprot:GHVN01062364.1.p1 GENE.GHVN01062364.1~~GHVN01062364.1.p1  ORF type:complete len:140 (-),score=36.61 GHVN01062364.1:93-512(-)